MIQKNNMQSPDEIKSRLFSLVNRGIKYDLDRMFKAASMCGEPQRAYLSVHVAGTNGKGSTCAYIESVLRRAGYRTGLYTSPHITNFEERFRIDGVDIGEDVWVDVYREQENVINGLGLTFFEAATLMAFEIFRRGGVQYAVFETGMGGRLDATNIITPQVSVITKLALDHREYLGGGLLEIAGEKLGIVKPGVPLVMLEPVDESIRRLARNRCRDMCSELTFVNIDDELDDVVCTDGGMLLVTTNKNCIDSEELLVATNKKCNDNDNLLVMTNKNRSDNKKLLVTTNKNCTDNKKLLVTTNKNRSDNENLLVTTNKKYDISLFGRHQAENAMLALAAVERIGKFDYQTVYDGMKAASISARFQVVDIGGWDVVFDVGHNPDAAAVLVDALNARFPGRRVSFVVGMMKDKDAASIINILKKRASSFYFAKPKTERAAEPMDLLVLTEGNFDGKAAIGQSVEDALRKAFVNTDSSGVICVTGSFYTVSEALKIIE